MKRHFIQSAQDVARIEAQPYAAFMAHEHVYAALEEAASRHADRNALTYLLDADPATPARSWSYRELLAESAALPGGFAHWFPARNRAWRCCCRRSPRPTVTLWGGETAGVVCPINFLLARRTSRKLVRVSGCEHPGRARTASGAGHLGSRVPELVANALRVFARFLRRWGVRRAPRISASRCANRKVQR